MQQHSHNPTRLRQIALLASDISAAEHILNTVLGTEVVFRDAQVAQWGLRNFLIAIGGDLIEVVSPFRDGTTAGRLLNKRGDGGYMIIMQTLDAVAQRKYIESNGLSKVIFSHETDDGYCIQYHPKGMPGGMMPELDSHKPSPANPEPLLSPFSPWHACGSDYKSYSAGMRRASHLQLLQATCRLKPGDKDTEGAAQTWERIFGVKREGSELVYTNGRLRFTKGVDGLSEGLESITVGVKTKARYDDILRRAEKENVYRDGRVVMLGLEWRFVLLPESEARSKI